MTMRSGFLGVFVTGILLAIAATGSSLPAAQEPSLAEWTAQVPPAGVTWQPELPYLAPERPERLDLFLPADRPAGLRSPAMVIIHGGGWAGVRMRHREWDLGCTLAKAGYVCVNLEYERNPSRRWPQNLLDGKNGVRFLRQNAEHYQIDPARIGVIGGSAGGHLALLVAYTTGVAELTPAAPYPGVADGVAACVDLYGITDLTTRQEVAADGTPTGIRLTRAGLFQDSFDQAPERWRLASPTSHVRAGCPPTLILHGTADALVDRDQSTRLAELLAAAGVTHELHLIPKAPHAFSLDDRKLAIAPWPLVLRFLERHLGGGTTPR